MKYWIIVENRHAGPFSARQLLDSGLMPDTLVWFEGLPDWTRADLVPELAEGLRLRDAAEPQDACAGTVEDAVEAAPEETPSACEPHEESTLREEHVYRAPMARESALRQPACDADSARWNEPQQPAESRQPSVAAEPCPPAYIAWSIVVTFLCCTIVGIPAIFFASMTKSAYYKGDIDKAKRYSELAQWFIIGSIVLGAVSWPFQIALMGLF